MCIIGRMEKTNPYLQSTISLFDNIYLNNNIWFFWIMIATLRKDFGRLCLKVIKPILIAPCSFRLLSKEAILSVRAGSGRYLKGGFEGYDENLRFYNTDNYFMWKYGQQYTHFCVIRYTLQHTLNFYDPAETFDKKAQRYREMRTSAIYLARLKSFWLALLMYLYYDVFSIKCAILNREIRFIFLR